jgi:hypothetical protein
MRDYRFFLWDRDNRIVGSSVNRCEDDEVERLAADVLRRESSNIHAVEVWHLSQRVARITRPEV